MKSNVNLRYVRIIFVTEVKKNENIEGSYYSYYEAVAEWSQSLRRNRSLRDLAIVFAKTLSFHNISFILLYFILSLIHLTT